MNMILPRWMMVLSIMVVGAAWYFRQKQQQQKQPPHSKPPSLSDPQPVSVDKNGGHSTIYAIGDLHGDVECARQWVAATGLISSLTANNDDGEEEETWIDPNNHLVFMGDYIDKGITSKQTVEFVKSLTDRFPKNVHAILGNHEVELLRDRTERLWNGAGFFQLAYSTLHPAEYLNYLDHNDYDPSVDNAVVEALYQASLQVYGRGLHRTARFLPDYTNNRSSILWLIADETLRDTVSQRLQLYQTAYLNAFRSNTFLGQWLERRPIGVILNDNLFVHGGWPQRLTDQNIHPQQVNDWFARHANETYLGKFLQTPKGRDVYDVLTYRGNHKEGCESLKLPASIQRLIVGHTPAANVRSLCQSRLWAIDSALSRWFRNSGNDYCLGDVELSYGNYQCGKKSNNCQGQIVRIRGNQVDILSLQ